MRGRCPRHVGRVSSAEGSGATLVIQIVVYVTPCIRFVALEVSEEILIALVDDDDAGLGPCQIAEANVVQQMLRAETEEQGRIPHDQRLARNVGLNPADGR